jgi:hypothetical protein
MDGLRTHTPALPLLCVPARQYAFESLNARLTIGDRVQRFAGSFHNAASVVTPDNATALFGS